MNIFSLQGKTAVVVGGSGLIGREIAAGLLQQGAKVYIADVARPKHRGLSLKTGFAAMDITSEKSIVESFRTMKNIDILINCAYPRTMDWGNKLEDVQFDSWKKNMNDHLGGYFLCCRAGAAVMKKRKKGSIVNIASIYGMVAPDFSIYEGTTITMPVAYAAIKSGLLGLTKYLSTYYARYNIRVNAVSPGGILDGQPASLVKKYSAKTPLGRMGNPQDIVGAVLYLASDASSYVTGQNIPVDGGWTAW